MCSPRPGHRCPVRADARDGIQPATSRRWHGAYYGGATAVSFILPEAIAAFQGAHPHVRFQMREAGSSEIADDVVAGHLELGVVTLPVRDRELEVTPWPPIASCWWRVTTTHWHNGGAYVSTTSPIRPSSHSRPAARFGHIIDGKLRDGGVEVNVVMELRSIPAILRMVSTTGNLAFVSQLGIEQQGDVIEVPVQGLRIERRLAVIARRGAVLSPAAAAFTTRLLTLQH